MAPVHSRQLLAWSLPTLAVLLSYFWFKRKRLGRQSDIRDTNSNQVIKVVVCDSLTDNKKKKNETLSSLSSMSPSRDIPQARAAAESASPRKPFSRSLSGVDSAPIDIIIPPDMRAIKSNHEMVISDEDLDIEIEKIKSMRSSLQRSSSTNKHRQSTTTPPIEETAQPEEQEQPFRSSKEVPEDDTMFTKHVTTEDCDIIKDQPIIQSKEEKTAAAKTADVIDSCEASSPFSAHSDEVTNPPVEATVPSPEMTTAPSEEAWGLAQQQENNDTTSVANKKTTSCNQQQQQPTKGKSKRMPNRMKETVRAEVRAVQREMEEKFSTGRIPPYVGGGVKKGGQGNKKVNNKRMPRTVEKGIGAQGGPGKGKEDAQQRLSSDRDSANHSPADIMMASPSLSNISDNGSSDSGKGGSDVVTPPNSHTNAYLRCDQMALHEFDVPSEIVGRLIGKKGSFVSLIKIKTNAEIVVKSYPPPFSDQKICVVEGLPGEIEAALKMIRRKFPLENYPKLTLQPWNSSPVQILPDQLHLKLVEGINNDTSICCVESPVHIFLHFPTHPSFMNLSLLQSCMNACYSSESPELPRPVPVSAICAAHTEGGWYRAQIMSAEDEDHSYIKFLDWGGYELVENTALRKIRCDFTYLPFQATECILANVQPVANADEEKQDEALDYVKEVSRTGLVITQVVDYTPEGVPLVLCYVHIAPNQVIHLNQDLVDRGYAEWILPEEPQQEEAAAVLIEPVAPTVEQQVY